MVCYVLLYTFHLSSLFRYTHVLKEVNANDADDVTSNSSRSNLTALATVASWYPNEPESEPHTNTMFTILSI